MKVLLVKPPFNKYTFVQHFMVCEPLEFEVLAAGLTNEHDVLIVDLRVDPHKLGYYLQDYNPDVVGFTALSMDVNTVRNLAKQVKAHNREIVTCVGGEHASFRPEDFETEGMDFIFQYDAISTFHSFLQKIEHLRQFFGPSVDLHQHLLRRQQNANINDPLSAARLPRRDLCERYLSKYIYGCANPVNLIQTTAGCAFRCSYCSIPSRQLNYVRRDIDVILEDIASTKAIDLLSIDANALQDVKKSLVLYEEIARADLKKRLMISCRTDTITKHPEILDVLKRAGVSVIAFGIESFNDDILDGYQKRNTGECNRRAIEIVHQHDILVRGNFIIDQRFTDVDFDRLIDNIMELNIEFPTFQILTPLPGTSFYEENINEILTDNFDYFDLTHSVLPTKLPSHKFHEQFQRLFRICYGPRRLFWLLPKIPVSAAFKSIAVAFRSHIEFSYRSHLLGT